MSSIFQFINYLYCWIYSSHILHKKLNKVLQEPGWPFVSFWNLKLFFFWSLPAIRCRSLSLVITCCHSLSLHLSLFVIFCHSINHSLSLVVTLWTTRSQSLYHSLTFVVTHCSTLCHLRLSFFKWCFLTLRIKN